MHQSFGRMSGKAETHRLQIGIREKRNQKADEQYDRSVVAALEK